MKCKLELRKPAPDALKEIKAGRLRGKTDINPQWRIDAMNEAYGCCGFGWQWRIVNMWTQQAGVELMVFAHVEVRVHGGDEGWGEWIPGVGGNKLITQESSGLHNSDEGYKMALTDALSVALKFFGVGAEVYRGHEVGKYDTGDQTPPPPPYQPATTPPPAQPPAQYQPATGVVRGVVINKEVKSGVGKTGKPYNKYTYFLDTNVKVGSFSDTVEATVAATLGGVIEFSGRDTQYGFDASSCRVISQPAHNQPPQPDNINDLPF